MPKPALKRALGEVLRKAGLLRGKYEFKVHAITTAKVSDVVGNFKLEVGKTERANRLKLTLQLSVKTNDTYAGILSVPMQVITADLPERLRTAGLALSALVVPETTMPTVSVAPPEDPPEPSKEPEVVPETMPLPPDDVLQRLAVLASDFRNLVQHCTVNYCFLAVRSTQTRRKGYATNCRRPWTS